MSATRVAIRKAAMDPGEGPLGQGTKEKSRNQPVSIDTSRSGPSTTKPFRGSWPGSETIDNDEDIEIDNLDRTEVAIAMLGAEIQELGEGVHLALGDRLGEDHLKSFPWISPGSAPGSGKWPKTPDSALSEHAKAIKEELKNQTYEALMKADEEFHKLMEDLDGITKW